MKDSSVFLHNLKDDAWVDLAMIAESIGVGRKIFTVVAVSRIIVRSKSQNMLFGCSDCNMLVGFLLASRRTCI
eukprot:scaffold6355_cov119-Cylindrotheca_fusiformis.AAC.15